MSNFLDNIKNRCYISQEEKVGLIKLGKYKIDIKKVVL